MLSPARTSGSTYYLMDTSARNTHYPGCWNAIRRKRDHQADRGEKLILLNVKEKEDRHKAAVSATFWASTRRP
jgi:hypothetical protein